MSRGYWKRKYCFYTQPAYIMHQTDSCAFYKFACIEGEWVLLLWEGFRGFPSVVSYFKITPHEGLLDFIPLLIRAIVIFGTN